MNQSKNGFPVDEIFEHFKGSNRALQFTDDDINNLLDSKYGHGDTVVILSILYPWADLKHNFHADHIFPKSSFTIKKLKAKGVTDDEIEGFIKDCNDLGNLQLLEEIPNIEKTNMDFEDWLKEKILVGELLDYKKKHYIPNVDLSYNNFNVFIEERERFLIQQLKNELRK